MMSVCVRARWVYKSRRGVCVRATFIMRALSMLARLRSEPRRNVCVCVVRLQRMWQGFSLCVLDVYESTGVTHNVGQLCSTDAGCLKACAFPINYLFRNASVMRVSVCCGMLYANTH